MQIPMVIGYHEMFEDLTTFHVWGTVCMNQAFNYSKNLTEKETFNNTAHDYISYQRKLFKGDYMKFNEGIIRGDTARSTGVSAMSLSDMTGIPRATVVRKLKRLIKKNYLSINDKKLYKVTNIIIKKLVPTQKIILNQLSDFSTKVFNLAKL